MGAAFRLAEGLKEERDVLEPGDLFFLKEGEKTYIMLSDVWRLRK